MSSLAKIVQHQLKHDAPYAWFLRNQASSSPVFRSQHISELDERLESYLACCQLNQTVLVKLNPSDWGAVYVTALVALRSNDLETFNKAIELVEEEQQAEELSDALCKVGFQSARPFLNSVLDSENPLVRVAAITASGYLSTSLDENLISRYLQDSPDVIVATLKVIGKNKLITFKHKVDDFLKHEDDNIRFHAAYSGCLIGISEATAVLQTFCFNENPHLRTALGLLYQVVDESAISGALDKIQNSQYSPRIKAYNIAMAGLPERIPVLLEWMKDPEYAPLAGEAFSFITGADIEEDDLSILDVSLCESQEAPLAEKRKNDPWTEGYEDDLPWPEPDFVKRWWQENQSRFKNGQRYLSGKTLTNDNLEAVLKEGTQPQRKIASLILAVKNPERLVEDTSGFYS